MKGLKEAHLLYFSKHLRVGYNIRYGENMEITLVGSKEGEWFDKFSRLTIKGKLYDFETKDALKKKWRITVEIAADGSKAVAWAPVSEGTDFISEQLKRKSVVFNSTKDGKEFYHIISPSQTTENRVRKRMLENLNEIPEELKQFKISRSHEVTDKKRFKNKLVIIVNKNDPESIAKIFYFEKINQLIK